MCSNVSLVTPSLILPPIRLFKELSECKQVQIEVCETFQKQSFRNRYVILGPNGFLALIVPVKKNNGSHTQTADVEIDYSTDWISQHLKSLKTAYSVSPFYIYYIDLIATEFQKKPKRLLTLNMALFERMISWLHIDCDISFTKAFSKTYESAIDLRYCMSQKSNWYLEKTKVYNQVFSNKFGFVAGLSILDVLFNLGPESSLYIKNC